MSNEVHSRQRGFRRTVLVLCALALSTAFMPGCSTIDLNDCATTATCSGPDEDAATREGSSPGDASSGDISSMGNVPDTGYFDRPDGSSEQESATSEVDADAS